MNDDGIMKLFYQNSKKYKCKSMNWGESKGTEYEKNLCGTESEYV